MKFMKRIIVGLGLLLLAFVVTGCGQAAADVDIAERIDEQKTPVLTWGVKADTNLFGYYNIESAQIEGFDVDIAKALTDEMTNGTGKAEFVEVTSKTRIPLLKNGKIDGILATMTITEEREKEVDFSDVYFNGGQSLLVHEDSEIESLEDLTEDHTVLAIKGSSSTQNMRELAPQVDVLDLENYSEGFVALQSGQGDALTTDNAILLGMIATNPDYRLAGSNFTDEPYGIAINKGQDEFHKRLEEALDTIQDNGVYDEVYAKWFGEILPADSPNSASTSTTGAANNSTDEEETESGEEE
jgi:ABC-type amino acid transport/signal transduction systems, periplasmic component/domain